MKAFSSLIGFLCLVAPLFGAGSFIPAPNSSGGGTNLVSVATNANQFGASPTLTIKTGAELTNVNIKGTSGSVAGIYSPATTLSIEGRTLRLRPTNGVTIGPVTGNISIDPVDTNAWVHLAASGSPLRFGLGGSVGDIWTLTNANGSGAWKPAPTSSGAATNAPSYIAGVDPTGTTDNAALIRQAITNAFNAGGGTLLLPPGVFRVDSTLHFFKNVALVGAGMDATTIRGASGITLVSITDSSTWGIPAYNFRLQDLTLDGNNAAAVGLYIQRCYAWQHHRVRFRRFTSAGVKLAGAPVGDFYTCHATENATGFLAVTNDNGSDVWQSNLINIYGGRHESNTLWAVDVDRAGAWNLVNANFEFCGTTGNDNTGVIRITNPCPTGEGNGISLLNVWAERNYGYAALYLGAPLTQDARHQWRGGLSKFNFGSDLKHGVYVASSPTYRTRLLTEGVTFGNHGLYDVALNNTNCLWEWGPTTIGGSVLTNSGRFAKWGADFNQPAAGASWQTLTLETFESATPPALPASISGNSGASLVTTTVNPQAGTVAARSSTTTSTEDFFYFSATDGHSGEARTTVDFRFESGGTGYSEIRAMVRAASKTASADCYMLHAQDNGSGVYTLTVFKRVSGSNTTLMNGTNVLTTGVYYRGTIETQGTTVRARIQRLSDNQWLVGGSWQAGEGDCYSGTDSSLSGAGYQGAQIYRESGAAQITADNLRAEAYY